MPSSLILIGASVRAAAASAARAGYQPYSIDLFADRDLVAIGPAVKIARYPAGFLAALAEAPPAPWIYTGGLENYPRLVDRLAALRPLWGNRGDVLREVRNPVRLAKIVSEAGYGFPETSFDGTAGPSSQWLVKPLWSSGGVAIRSAKASDFVRLPRGTYLQRYVDGDSLSAVFVAAGGRAKLLGVTQQLLGRDFSLPRPFLYVGSVGPIFLGDDDRVRIRSLGNVLAEQFRLAGLFNVDFVRNETGLWPLEVNPRYSASIEVLERATGCAVVKLHIDACERAELADAVSTETGRCSGKAVVYAPADGIFSKRLDDLAGDWNAGTSWPAVADLPHVGEPLRRGQPVVTVFADGDSLVRVEAELRHGVGIIERLLSDS